MKLNQKFNNASVFGKIIALYFVTDEGRTLLSNYTEKYGYKADGNYVLSDERKSFLLFDDLSMGGSVCRFAPDYDTNDFCSLVNYVQKHLDINLNYKDFNNEKFRETPITYLLKHKYIRNQFEYAFLSQLRSRFKQSVKVRLTQGKFLVEHKRPRAIVAMLNWAKTPEEKKREIFHSNFGQYTDILPNTSVIAELNLYSNTRLDLLEVRQSSAVYVVIASGRVHQIFRNSPNQIFCIFNDYAEYLSVEPTDNIVQYFSEPNIRVSIFFKGGFTHLRHKNGLAKVFIDPQNRLYLDKIVINPGVSEDEERRTIESFKKMINERLPLACFQSKNAKQEFKKFLPYFYSEPRDIYF